MAFKMLRNVFSIPTLWRVLIRNGCCILSKAFSASNERIIWFLVFLLLIWWITLIVLPVLNQPCVPGINLTWPSNCAVGDLPQRCRCNETPGHLHPDVYSSNVHNSQTWKEPRCPLKDEWIEKMLFMYTMEYYSAIRNDKYPPFASTWMELEGIMLSEVSRWRTNIICSHSFGEYK